MRELKELFSVFDLIDEIVYVSDVDNYELIYCNEATKKFLGFDFEDVPGEHKCYKLLSGKEHPCVYCNNEELKVHNTCIWSRVHPKTLEEYFIHDTLISPDGRNLRLELAMNASKVESFNERNKSLLDVETNLTQCVRKLVQSEDFAEAVETVLEAVLSYYNAERAYLFDFDWEKKVSSNRFEICAPGISEEIENLQGVPIEVMHFWIDIFSRRTILSIENIEEYAEDPSRTVEYETLSAQGITSLLAVPIFENNVLKGFVGVDNPKDHVDKGEFLKELTYFIGTEFSKKNYLDELVDMSFTDRMCGVGNRNAYALFERECAPEDRRTLGLAFLDMNGLKYLNDHFGHDYGDRQIRKFCKILKKYASADCIFRMSGDEFVIVAPMVSYEEFNCKMRRLKHEVYKEEHGLAALGFVWDDSDTPLHLLQNQAEQLMNAEKQKYYSVGVDDARGERPMYLSSVLESLKHDTYLVYLQPKLCIGESTVCAAEALVRKLDDEGNIVYPQEFIKALEKENAVSFVDYFVFEKVCEALKRWEVAGHGDFLLSSNFSRKTIAEEDFAERVLEIVEKTGVNAKQLILEVTESSNAILLKKLAESMSVLRERGIRFALDDMGSEYATLQMLELEGLDVAKFDRNLIRRMKSGTRTQTILTQLVALCHTLGMKCVAEGVETEEQLEAVKESGCDAIQGFLIGKPMPMEEFEKEYIYK